MAANPDLFKDAGKGIREAIKKDHEVAQFEKMGNALLEKTNRPNVITVAQFVPYIPLFTVDKEKYDPDQPNAYFYEINRLYHRWRFDLGINPYEVVYVIVSQEDQRIVCALNRQFSRIHSDEVGGNGHRDNIPANITRGPADSKDGAVLNATVRDLMDANQTPEQTAFFQRLLIESTVSSKIFSDLNQSGDAEAAINGKPAEKATTSTTIDDDDSNVIFLDDE